MSDLRIRVDGVDETIQALESLFGDAAINRMIDRALTAGANVIKHELETNFEGFKKSGASKAEITISEPMTLNEVRTVVIYWQGPKNRWAILHLNEYGTIQQPRPRGFGAIDRAIRQGEAEYNRVIVSEVERHLS